MQSFTKIESTEYTDLGKVIRWFINLRWIAAAGVLSALFVGRLLYHFALPFTVLYSLAGALVFVNLGFTVYFYVYKNYNLSRNEMGTLFHIQICSDYIFLFLLVYFTGFLENPLVYYFVFHIMLTSFLFSRRIVSLYVFSLIVLFALVAVGEYTNILPHFSLRSAGGIEEGYSSLILVRTFALCSTLVLTAYLIGSIKERLEERGHRVEVELDRYKSLDRAKSNFILQVTHEIRGPIAALKGYHEMIQKGITGQIPDRTKQTIERANHRTQNLLNIIDEMIDFAYMKSEEEKKYTRTELNVRSIIQYNLDLFITMAQKKKIKTISSCPKELVIEANRDLLNIILGNLITNALKYSGNGTTVTVNAQEEGKDIHLLIKDEGMGIEPGEIEKIFEEFYRTRRAREIEQDGTGLGLSIVQKAVNFLRGRITIYSEVNNGTSFHIFLPKRIVD